MKLKTFRHLWGVPLPYEEAFPLIRQAGYDGIECKAATTARDPLFKQLVKQYGFEVIAQIHTSGESVDEHMASFKELVQASLLLNPVLINSQSGKDRWSNDEKQEFTARALDYEKKMGIAVAHEIHRGRITYNPWDTRDLLLEWNELKLCCDFSHWVCVCERIIDNEQDIIQLCASRCIHLHARVGYEQGPQVPDPGAPEYAAHLLAHESWWTAIWQKQLEKGLPVSTLTPEFGPPPYQHTLPFSSTPVSDLWAICDWMNNRQKERFNHFINTAYHASTNGSNSKRTIQVAD